ncbi:sensor domain-containing diguanylate cyclase [Stutzerimonas tarimensis]|uniref:diguanylate cyclase n=1 Tax=Stutzerimonas tarimensis TaxID=1507735 RepID=A0ABV7T8J4_9GAMM
MPSPDPADDPDRSELNRLREIVDHNSDWLWEVDAEARYTFSSERCRHLLGYAPEEMIGKRPFDFMPPAEAERVAVEFQAVVAARRPFAGLINRNLRADGSLVVLETSGIPLFAADGSFRGYRGIDRDISPDIGPLSQRSVQLEALYAAAPVPLALLNREGRFVNMNQAMASLCASEPVCLVGQALNDHIDDAALDLAAVFTRLECGTAGVRQELHWQQRTFQVALEAVRDVHEELVGLTLALTDITDLQRMRRELGEANARLSHLAQIDHLTGLYNRRRFDEQILTEIARAQQSQQPLSLLMVDIDHYKGYNDCYGHRAGDHCLRRIADIVRDTLSDPMHVACRYGGEEFTIILPQSDAPDSAAIAELLRHQLAAANIPHLVSPFGRLTLSIGAATLLVSESDDQDHGQSAERLLQWADRALYRAKSLGRNRVELAARPSTSEVG